jgi:hypothetical protein
MNHFKWQRKEDFRLTLSGRGVKERVALLKILVGDNVKYQQNSKSLLLQCRTVPDSMGQCRTIIYSTGQWRTMEDRVRQYRTVHCSAGQWRTMEDRVEQYRTVHCSAQWRTIEEQNGIAQDSALQCRTMEVNGGQSWTV